MSFLSKIAKVVVPTAIGFATGGPAGAFAAGVGASQAEKAERRFKEAQQIQAKESDMSEIFGRTSTFRDPYAGTGVLTPNVGTQASGGGFFSDEMSEHVFGDVR